MLAIFSIAPVALNRYDLFGHINGLVGLAEAEHVGGARKGVNLAMGHAHAAADRDIVAGYLALLDDGDVTKVMCEDIDIVRRRNGNNRLELARQVNGAVNRLIFFFRRLRLVLDQLTVEPDFMIGAGVRQQMLADIDR